MMLSCLIYNTFKYKTVLWTQTVTQVTGIDKNNMQIKKPE